MDLEISSSYNERTFTEYHVQDRNYVLLFYKNDLPGPFFVTDSPLDLNTLFHFGEIHQGNSDGKIVGAIFYTKYPFICEGTFALAYSGALKKKLNARLSRLNDMNMELVLKAKHFYAYSKVNEATLLVNPSLRTVIRKNFEV